MNDALLLVDVIDDFGHEDGEALLRSFRSRQPALVRALADARGRVPVVYGNDMRDRWDSDAPGYVAGVRANGLGGDLIAEIAPAEDDVSLDPELETTALQYLDRVVGARIDRG